MVLACLGARFGNRLRLVRDRVCRGDCSPARHTVLCLGLPSEFTRLRLFLALWFANKVVNRILEQMALCMNRSQRVSEVVSQP